MRIVTVAVRQSRARRGGPGNELMTYPGAPKTRRKREFETTRFHCGRRFR